MATRTQHEPVLLQLPCVLDQGVAYPRPQRVLPRNSARNSACSQLSGVQSTVGLTGVQHGHNGSFGSSSEVELLEIMLKPSDAPCCLGVSPPVRSGCWGGAANPWSHDRSWKLSAYSASSTNLQALRELDSEGESFLKAKDSGAGKLVLGVQTSLPDPADCSDAGSDGTAVNECAPFTCHTEYFLG